MEKFIKDLKESGGHLLKTIAIPNGTMLYYREFGTYVNDVKTIVF